MRILFALLFTFALLFGVHSANVGLCQFTGDYTGSITFTEVTLDNYVKSVHVSGTIISTKGITGEKGLHIHQYGDIRNQSSAGSHFNPYGNSHACSYPNHLGDLGNVNFEVPPPSKRDDPADPIAPVDFDIKDADLSSLNTLIGRTLVLHSEKDPCTPTGTFGDRVAQCVIGYVAGNVGYTNVISRIPAPKAICILPELEITFTEDEDQWGTVIATINDTIVNNIFLTPEMVNSTFANETMPIFETDDEKTVSYTGASIRLPSNGTILSIIGKALWCKISATEQHSCVIGFMNADTAPATTTSTTTSSSTSATTGSSTSTGDATTGEATSTTTGAANATSTTTGDLTGNATSTTGSTTMTNTTTDASSTSGQAINPALNTTDTSGGAVLGIIFATFILLGLAWYTYVNRGNNQRRIGYFGV